MVSRLRFVNRILGRSLRRVAIAGYAWRVLDRRDEELGQCSDVCKVLSTPGEDVSDEDSRAMVACALCGLGEEAQKFS